MDTSPKICIERIKRDRFSVELFEKVEKLKRVRKGYFEVFKKFKNICIIDGNKSIKDVSRDIKKVIKNKF